MSPKMPLSAPHGNAPLIVTKVPNCDQRQQTASTIDTPDMMFSCRQVNHNHAATPCTFSWLQIPLASLSARPMVQGRGQSALERPFPCQKAVVIFEIALGASKSRAIMPNSAIDCRPVLWVTGSLAPAVPASACAALLEPGTFLRSSP